MSDLVGFGFVSARGLQIDDFLDSVAVKDPVAALAFLALSKSKVPYKGAKLVEIKILVLVTV